MIRAGMVYSTPWREVLNTAPALFAIGLFLRVIFSFPMLNKRIAS